MRGVIPSDLCFGTRPRILEMLAHLEPGPQTLLWTIPEPGASTFLWPNKSTATFVASRTRGRRTALVIWSIR